jgi:predicted dehydrogenase
MDLGCYPLSWALQVTKARPSHIEAKAKLTERGVDESMTATLTFANAVQAKLSASMSKGENFLATLNVKGSKGEIEFVNPLAPHHGSKLTLKKGGREISPRVSRISTYAWQLDTVIHALEAGLGLPTEGDAIVTQQEVLDGIYAAAGLAHLRYRS